MRRTVVGLFKSINQAKRAITEIEGDHLANNQISLVLKQPDFVEEEFGEEFAEEINTTAPQHPFDGIEGLLITTPYLEVEGIGKVAAGGPLAGALAQGDKSLAETLTYYGVSKEEAKILEKEVDQGLTLAVIETNNSKVNNVANVLSDHGGRNVKKWSKSIEKPLLPHNG